MYRSTLWRYFQERIFLDDLRELFWLLVRRKAPTRAHKSRDVQGHYDIDGVSYARGHGVIVASAKKTSLGLPVGTP
jgi:hypothetical protein